MVERIGSLENADTRCVGQFEAVPLGMLPTGCSRIEFLSWFRMIRNDRVVIAIQGLEFGNKPNGDIRMRNTWNILGPAIPGPIANNPGAYMQIDRTVPLDAEVAWVRLESSPTMEAARLTAIDAEHLFTGAT